MAINLMIGKQLINSSYGVDTSKVNDHIDNSDLHISTTDRNLLTSLNHNKGVFSSETDLRATYPTANAGDYCICFNGTDYTMWTYSTDWTDTGDLGSVQEINGQTGSVTLDSSNINYDTGVTLKNEIDKKLNNDDVLYANSSDINNLF